MKPVVGISKAKKLIHHGVAARVGQVLIPDRIDLVVDAVLGVESGIGVHQQRGGYRRLAEIRVTAQRKVGEFLCRGTEGIEGAIGVTVGCRFVVNQLRAREKRHVSEPPQVTRGPSTLKLAV